MLVHDCITCIAKEEDLMILSLAQNKKELQVFHQPTALGGSLDDPADHYVALLGMGPTANPIEIDATLVQDIEILRQGEVSRGRIREIWMWGCPQIYRVSGQGKHHCQSFG